MKARDLRNMDASELKDTWEGLEEKLFNLRFQSVTEEIQSPSEISLIRKDIARIQTVLREQELKAKAEAQATEKSADKS